ncbi:MULTISPECIES: hypothetical protein [unclassified Actinoplanes]|uniref:hypothetical protein n=1 Tax=unclassified Actinoplanes TaxID=2626549 RepID=UPI001E53E0C3|nr:MULTISPECIES: hypothetical protein [unclassified Actinoplanes]
MAGTRLRRPAGVRTRLPRRDFSRSWSGSRDRSPRRAVFAPEAAGVAHPRRARRRPRPAVRAPEPFSIVSRDFPAVSDLPVLRIPPAPATPAAPVRRVRTGTAPAPVPPLFPAWPAVALYLVLRAVSLIFTWHFVAEKHRDPWALLGAYDAAWYAGIARHGYDTAIPVHADGTLAPTNLAFFPLFPALARLADPLVPGGADRAGIAVAWLAGLVAAGCLYAVGARLHDRATGILLAGLWAVLPHAVVESMGYTETLFTALAAAAVHALTRGRWLTAAALCALAGLTRPTAAALIAVVGAAALVAIVRRRDGWRPWAAAALAPIGLLGYAGWVGWRLGRADGYVHVQKDAWRMSYDLGGYTVRAARGLLTGESTPAYFVVTLLLIAALTLLAVLATDPVAPWQLKIYSAAIVALAFFGHGYYHSKARLLLPAFPLLLPVAATLARARRTTVVAVLAAMTLISAAYGVYLCTVWTWSP